MSDERQEIDLLQQELSNILKQLQGEMDNEVEVEEIGGVNLKELEQTFNDGQPKMELKFVKMAVGLLFETVSFGKNLISQKQSLSNCEE